MAYDRYDTRDYPREGRSRWRDERSDERGWGRDRGSRDDRGFFERAGDEVASWFGDDEAERRREQDRLRDEREGRYNREFASDEDQGRFWRDRSWDRGDFERDEERFRPSGWGSRGGQFRERGSYRPMTGDYSRSEGFFAAGGKPRGRFSDEDRFSRSGSFERSRDFDPHYRSWRDRHMSDLDRDYDEFRRENQSRFEDDFGGWRERRMQKRGLLAQIREHMEVVGNDDQHVGTIDHVVGDRIILAKSDPESGGVHHSLSCSDIGGVEGDKVVLDCTSEQAKQRWRDESRSRALFEREDQGEMGPRMLDRSFEGTYRQGR